MAEPLDLVVRFSISLPDLILRVDTINTITAASLKQLIRAQLKAPASTSRLRLIHAGKVLPDNDALSKSLNVTHPPPPPAQDKSAKAKGKQPIRDSKLVPAARVYIHCSLGDALTPSELSAEVKVAQEADVALETTLAQTSLTSPLQHGSSSTTTTPAPRGFDRLLTTGFSPSEVATLRTQFLAIQSYSHTPDTMPTGAELLALEERWLDNTHGSATSGAGGADADTEDSGGLEDMLYGNLMGFFWPVGAFFWLMREEGVWSRRRQIAVLSGFLVNLTFGFLRVMN